MTESPNTSSERAPLNRSWVVRMTIITVAFIGFGLWGFYDATVAYPNRGERASQWFEKAYLEAMDDATRLGRAAVTDPVEQLADDEEQVKTINELASTADRTIVQTRRVWLKQLEAINQLTVDRTDYPRAESEGGAATPRDRLAQLDTQLAGANQPKALSAFDVTVQWIIFYVCTGIGLLVIANMLRVKAQKFTFDQRELRLTLPSGDAIVPTDIELFDKRKWDKFIVFLKIGPSHSKLSGQEIRLDLLRHAKLEDWILAMEESVNPAEESAEPASEEAAGEPAQEPAQD